MNGKPIDKDYSVKPYPPCKGLKWRRPRYWKKHKRPFAILYMNKICNCYFSQKNKIRFIQQFFRWFIKAPEGFKIQSFLKNPYTYKDLICTLHDGDIIRLGCKSFKAGWKKLLSKLNYEIIDYEPLRQRRKYSLDFIFFFSNVHLKKNDIMIDITCTKYNYYQIFIVIDGSFFNSFQLIFENIKIWPTKLKYKG